MDKVVLVTGAGSGIGKAIALQYATLKAKLSIVDRDAKSLNETAQNCTKLNNSDGLRIIVDMAVDEDVKTLVDHTLSKFGRIDILINCAGVGSCCNILDTNLIEDYDKVMAVNLRSVVLLTSLCAPHLINSKGCIINITSVLSVLTNENCIGYSISKAALSHFTRCTALELAAHGVRVNAVSPGVVNSNIYINAGYTKKQSEAAMKSSESVTPLKHVIETNEVANLVLFLSSNKARNITGASYVIDAGTSLTGFKEFEFKPSNN